MRKIPIFLLCLIIGCGGGSEGSGIFVTGINKNATVSSLTSAQIDQACAKYSEFFNKFFIDPRSCYIDGLAETRLLGTGVNAQNQCSVIVDECFSNPSQNSSLGDLNSCDLQELERSVCTATIEQYEACVVERSGKLEALLGSLSCQQAGDENYYNQAIEDFFGDEIVSGPACQQFLSSCQR